MLEKFSSIPESCESCINKIHTIANWLKVHLKCGLGDELALKWRRKKPKPCSAPKDRDDLCQPLDGALKSFRTWKGWKPSLTLLKLYYPLDGSTKSLCIWRQGKSKPYQSILIILKLLSKTFQLILSSSVLPPSTPYQSNHTKHHFNLIFNQKVENENKNAGNFKSQAIQSPCFLEKFW